MKKEIPIFRGYSFIEMLVVMAIFIILASFGIGGYIGFRETMLSKENVENIKQDVILAQQKAMLLERDVNDTWLYGIGIDFSKIDVDGTYTFFKWCSPFTDFGNDITRSKIVGWDPSKIIGENISWASIIDGMFFSFDNGILPTTTYKTKCSEGYTSKVKISGEASDKIMGVGDIEILNNVKYIVFEAVTGRAFLYDTDGYPISYETDGDYIPGKYLDIVLKRKRSSKFDVLTIYPLSGTVIDYVYSDKDRNESCISSCITVDEKTYDRYGIYDEIKSYRTGDDE